MDAYLTFAFEELSGRPRHRFVRDLFKLSRQMSADLFEKAVSRAHSYRVVDLDAIYRIAVLQMKDGKLTASPSSPSTESSRADHPSWTEPVHGRRGLYPLHHDPRRRMKMEQEFLEDA